MSVQDIGTGCINSGRLESQVGRAFGQRIAWADLAKGWTIALVVIMHSSLGVSGQLGEVGWLHQLVVFAKPFRMPDFFLVAGLFAGVAVNRSWLTLLDRRVLHFAYFYLLWALILIVLKVGVESRGNFDAVVAQIARSIFEPFSALWFIYVLPAMFLTVRLAAGLPSWAILFAAGCCHLVAANSLEQSPYALSSHLSGWFPLDSYMLFIVFFLAGHYGRDVIFRFAGMAAACPVRAAIGLGVWGAAHGLAIKSGVSDVPGVTLVAGLAGALAVIAVSALLARFWWMHWLAAIGQRSLVIYLSFTIPMAAMRIALIQTGAIADVGWMSAIISIFALTTPLALASWVRGTPLAFLFTRPKWARLPKQAGLEPEGPRFSGTRPNRLGEQ